MYKTFRVKNFRCFKDFQINDLGRVNLIAGKNNTGKTALMEAIHIHSGNRDPRTFLRKDHVRSTHRRSTHFLRSELEEDSTNITSWAEMFHNFNMERPVELYANIRDYHTPLFGDTTPIKVRLSVTHEGSEAYESALENLLLDDIESSRRAELLEIRSEYSSNSTFFVLLDRYIYSSRSETESLFESEFLRAKDRIRDLVNVKRFSLLRLTGKSDSVQRGLTVIEPRLNDLELLHDGYRMLLYAHVGLKQPIPLSALGEGVQRIASITLAITDDPIGAVFIDEIENGIHHSVQTELWKFIGDLARRHNIQVFATTHSLEMVRAAYEAFAEDNKLEEFRYHRLDRDAETGDIEAVTYNEPALDAVATFDFDFEVRG